MTNDFVNNTEYVSILGEIKVIKMQITEPKSGIMWIFLNRVGEDIFRHNKDKKVELNLGAIYMAILFDDGKGLEYCGNDDFIYLDWM